MRTKHSSTRSCGSATRSASRLWPRGSSTSRKLSACGRWAAASGRAISSVGRRRPRRWNGFCIRSRKPVRASRSSRPHAPPSQAVCAISHRSPERGRPGRTRARDDRHDSRSGLTATTLRRSIEAAGLPAASAFQGTLTAFADLEDGGVQDDVGVLLGELALLLERVDLVVLTDEYGLDALLPGEPNLFPEGVVVRFARLRTKYCSGTLLTPVSSAE